jgi:hypothetical protein
MVDAHPDIAVIHESHWIPRFYEERIGLTPDGMVTKELAGRLLDDRRFAKLGIGRDDLRDLTPQDAPISYADYVTRIFDLYGQARGKRLVGEKTPGYVRSIPTLHYLWPEAKFVHLMRDGRDVFLSMKNWKRVDRSVGRFAAWRRDPVSTSAYWWKWDLERGREAASLLGPDLYHELRYEGLVSEPTEELAKLCAFLGLPYHEAMLGFHEGRTKTKPGLDAKRAWLPITQGLRDWRTEMSATDVERFEAAVGGLLDDLGYERAFPNPSSEAVERASESRRRFVRELGERERRTPANWQC